MRSLLAKILFLLAAGLLSGHQFIAHHHAETEISTDHHGDDENDDDHTGNLPPHHITTIYQVQASVALKISPQNVCVDLRADFSIAAVSQPRVKKEYVEIRPPLIRYYRYFSLRAPPSLT